MMAAQAQGVDVKSGVKRGRKILGYLVLAVGGAAILVGISPLFPVFLEAFLVGGALIAAGLWILAGPEVRASLRKEISLRSSGRTTTSRREDRRPARVLVDPLLPVRILRLAREHGGILTVALVAMELSVPLDQAEAGLSECVRAGNAMPDYDIAHAHALYRFPEFIEPGSDEDPARGAGSN